MHLPRIPHPWSVSAEEGVAIQRRLAAGVLPKPPRTPLRFVAGMDCAFSSDGHYCIAGVVLWDMARREAVESRVARCEITMPYVPGLLSFREGPALLAALQLVRCRPDVLMCDGQGIAHPRRLGIAAHLGVVTGMPAVGCAKSRLCGSYGEPGPLRCDRTELIHRGETIGVVLRTRDRVRPLFISIGHKLDLRTAVELVLNCGAGYRLPEPTRLADKLVAEAKRTYYK
ncbi:MAG: deoxyribonuclease V [Chitinivibrionales bacterium]|nr:deoxyribonuclease V [Chitinivibrionales bacterium]MBD3358890.1 deoxyribonuclease V [Chitinivibrionales bacterium]